VDTAEASLVSASEDARHYGPANTATSASADTVAPEQRAYSLRVTAIEAIDETGSFNTGLGDEIHGGFRVDPTPDTAINEFQTRIFGNFDAGESRTVPAGCTRAR
jgi:hypothetical protein